MSMRRFVIVFTFLLASTVLAQTAQLTLGPYLYDGAGNIRNIGTEQFLYDRNGRLMNAAMTPGIQTFGYDPFGNRTSTEISGITRCNGGADCRRMPDPNIAPRTNHITDAAYNAAGAMKSIDGRDYTYDPTGMLTSQHNTQRVQYVYTADDERIAVYSNNRWGWSLRDPTERVIRQVTSDDATSAPASAHWTWAGDQIFRAGSMLASERTAGRRHFHLDHLGTPRLITTDTGVIAAQYEYYAFGPQPDDSAAKEIPAEELKFTGHQRDLATGDVHVLDYMHARYYNGTLGRFLSLDPVLDARRNLKSPQRWNRYLYAADNPIAFLDPDGQKDTIYIINTLGGGAFGPAAMAKLTAAVKGTRFEGHIRTIGPMASRDQVHMWMNRADKTDMTAVLIHSGSTNDWKPQYQGFMMTQANLGDESKGIAGTTLARWAGRDGSAPAVCMIAGCNSQEIAAAVSSAGTVAFGTTENAIAGEQGMAVAATLGAMAQGASPEEAAAAGSREYKTPANECRPGDPTCDPKAVADLVVDVPER
jgi:RHS repeat-associated protein